MKKTSPTGNRRDSIKARLNELRHVESQQGPEAAEKGLIALIKEQPKAALAYLALVRVLLRQKKYDYAVRAAEKAVALSGLDARAHTVLGVARMRNDDLQGAEAAFAQALDLDKDFPHAILGAAAVKMVHENYDDALALCERALELSPEMARAHELVARINLRQGNPEAAAAELRQLLENDTSNDRALRSYLRLMRKEGKLGDIVELAEISLATEPPTPRSVSRYARMVGIAGKPELAVAQYRKLIASGEARGVDRMRFITALIAAGQLDEARSAIAELDDRRVLAPLKQKLEGDIALARGEPAKAVEHYRTACTSAGADELAEDAASEDGETLAREWQKHTAKALRAALKELRQGRTAANG